MPISDVRLWLAILAFMPPALAQGSTDADRRKEAPASSHAALIREVLTSTDPTRTVELSSARLAKAGSALIADLVDVLVRGVLPGGTGAEPLDAHHEEIVVSTLAKFRRSELARRVDLLLEPTARPAARRAGLRLLGALGDRQDLPLLCAALRRPDPDEDPDPGEARLFQSASAAILKRDPCAYATVRTLLHAESPSIRYYLIGALGDSGSAEGLDVLSSQMRARPAEDLLLLCTSARLAASVALPVDERIPAAFRIALADEDPNEVRAAAECLGWLEDVDSAQDLAGLLEHPHPDVARTALESLRVITGANLLPDAGRWRDWLRTESEWFSSRMENLAADLRGPDALLRMAAIEEMAGHPLHRREIAEVLEAALAGAQPELESAGCAALGQLRAATAVPFLETCAGSAAPEVAAEARRALQAIRDRRAPRPGLPGGPQGTDGPDR